MAIRWYAIVIDSHDVAALARWWSQALGWPIVYEAPDEVVICPEIAVRQAADPAGTPFADRSAGWVFVTVPEGKTVKNRVHVDLSPDRDADLAAEVERLVALGAHRVDIGQGDEVPWVVLADPEGNEFCVLTPRD